MSAWHNKKVDLFENQQSSNVECKITNISYNKTRTDKEQEIIISLNGIKKSSCLLGESLVLESKILKDDLAWQQMVESVDNDPHQVMENCNFHESINPVNVSIEIPTNYWTELRDTKGILDWVIEFFPELRHRVSNIEDLVKDAYEIGSSVFGAESAVKWAQNFKIPKESVDSDVNDFNNNHNKDFIGLVKARQAALQGIRLNKERVLKFINPLNPERDLLLMIAQGVPVLESPDWKGNGYDDRPHLAHSFTQAAPAVEKMFYKDFWEEGLAIILTAEEVKTIPQLGLCLAGWAKKLGKECGRPITNSSGRRSMIQEEYLNSLFTKEQSILLFGKIEHPVIGDIPRMIMELEEKNNWKREDLRVWKFDLRKAYTLLTYKAVDVSKIGVELSEDLFMFFLAGVFGLTGMPYVFQVITRALVWEINNSSNSNSRFRGILRMYVDDGLAVCHKDDLENDKRVAFEFIRNLLGDNAIESSKTKDGLNGAIEFIGYEINLLGNYVTVADKNLKKAFFRFSDVDLSDGALVPVKTMQALASLGSRYGYISHLMRPFVRILYSSFRGRGHLSTVVLTDNAKRIIRLFQCLFINLYLNKDQLKFSRKFESFKSRPHTWSCEYDASLHGIGIMWFKVDEEKEGEETLIAYAKVDISFMNFGTDSSFQNTCEYMGSLLCAHGMNLLGVGSEPVQHRGDSKTALSWVQKGTTKSDPAIKAGLMWGIMVMSHESNVQSQVKLTHEENSRADLFSRGHSYEDVLREDKLHYGGKLAENAFELNLDCRGLLDLCNPRNAIDNDEDFFNFFKESLNLIKK